MSKDTVSLAIVIALSVVLIAFIGAFSALTYTPPEPKVSLRELQNNKKIGVELVGQKVVATVPKLRGVKAIIGVLTEGQDLSEAAAAWQCSQTEFDKPDSIATHRLEWRPSEPGVYYFSLLVVKDEQMVEIEPKKTIEVRP